MAKNELNVKAWAASAGILWGLYVFLAALFAMKGVNTIWFSDRAFEMLMAIYPGLSATVLGAFVGLIYGAVCGAICAGLFSWLHNKALKWF